MTRSRSPVRGCRGIHSSADLLRRIGRADEARAAYRAALGLSRQAPERRFIERQLADLGQQAAS